MTVSWGMWMVDPHSRPRMNAPRTSGDLPARGAATPVVSADAVEANERLIRATLDARADAEAARLALNELVRTTGLDPLTQLPTRVLMLDRFAQAIHTAKRHSTHVALLFVDLDNFKLVNDTLGHSAGDKALQHIAHCIVSSIREVDTVSRYGGDEFLILLPEITAKVDALLVADKVVSALARPVRLFDQMLWFTASVGISFYPTDGEDPEALIERADAAMYRAKRRGQGRICVYRDPCTDDRRPEIDELMGLQRALAHEEVEKAALEHENYHATLQEANERLVVAALNAQKLQGAAEKAYRRQAEFLGVLAHELRHPLAPIRNAAELLGRVSAEELPRIQAMIARQVKHMARIVDDLLDVKRVGTGKLQLEPSLIDMRDVICAAATAARPMIDARQQHFALQVVPDALPMLGDSMRLEQVVRNLLDNASKYTPKGGTIQLSTVIVDGTLVMSVADTGIGIPGETLPLVFEPFVQDRSAVAFNGAGLGIGLTVVRQLVEAHGGQIVAHSAGSGMGSQFVLTLPLSTS